MRGSRMPSGPITRMCSAMRRREGRSMRAFACALAASLLAAPGGAEARGGAASLNLCTDELLLLLAAPAQVASVTYLSQDPLDSPLWRSARRYRGNDGSLLSIAAETPALVIDMGGGGR